MKSESIRRLPCDNLAITWVIVTPSIVQDVKLRHVTDDCTQMCTLNVSVFVTSGVATVTDCD
jgi:hypothetical protein